MKKTLACSVALMALGFAAPLKAERVYVPVIDALGANGKPLTTQLWISNFDGVERSYSSVFLESEADGTELSGSGPRNLVPANKAAYLRRAADEGETGLLEIDAADLSVNAWIQTSRGGRTFYTGVPVISEATRVEAVGFTFEQGKTYHVRVVQNALSKSVICTLSLNGTVVRRMDLPGSIKNREIQVLASGLVAEFGNFNNQHLPEVSSIGWKYSNFRVRMIPR